MIIDYDENNVAHVNLEGKTRREYVLDQAKQRYLERHRYHVESYPSDAELIRAETRQASKVMRQVLAPGRPAGSIQNQCIAYRNLCWLVLQAEKQCGEKSLPLKRQQILGREINRGLLCAYA